MGSPKRSVLHLDGVAEILNLLDKNKEMRFNSIMERLKAQKNPPLRNAAALSYRLRGLERAGLIRKRVENKAGKQAKIFYNLTKEGSDALLHLNKLNQIIREAGSLTEEGA